MTQDNRELLELAAKAAGYKPDGSFGRGLLVVVNPFTDSQKAFPFDPINDDGDALRLAVRLKINLFLGEVGYATAGRPSAIGHRVPVGDDADAAARFAILCVAADIGRTMP